MLFPMVVWIAPAVTSRITELSVSAMNILPVAFRTMLLG